MLAALQEKARIFINGSIAPTLRLDITANLLPSTQRPRKRLSRTYLRLRWRKHVRRLPRECFTYFVLVPQRHSRQADLAQVLALGTFDQSGSATIRIRVTGKLGHKDYEATIDTGFSGFVALPTKEMIPLGLSTGGATTVMLGNGSVIDNLVASASVTLCGQTIAGTVLP
jgi:hypothetical protein